MIKSTNENSEEQGTYLGGSYGAVLMYNRRRKPVFGQKRRGLPSVDRDISSCLTATIISSDNTFKFSFWDEGDGNSPALQKLYAKFLDQREIVLFHAFCVIHLRRKKSPPEALFFFHKLWDHYGDQLSELLDVRWLISAMTTFSDHGKNSDQRVAGSMFCIFFGMLKLYEWERLISKPPGKYFRVREGDKMPIGLSGFSLKRGDLDYNLIARLHEAADKDHVMQKIGHVLLHHLNYDDRNIFRRLSRSKDPKRLLSEKDIGL